MTGTTPSPDVLVIGAGALGCHAAWQLRQRGLNVLVLEAGPTPAAQTTRAAAGFVVHFSTFHRPQWEAQEWHLQQYGIQFYTDLAHDSDRDIGFNPSGIAYIHITEDGWNAAQAAIAGARSHGTTLEILSHRRAGQVVPQIRFAQTAGIAFDPRAIRLRAGDAIALLADRLAEQGVDFQFNTQVQGFVRNGDRLTGVRTNAGPIYAPTIVVAAGAWSRPLLKGLVAPLAAEPRLVARYTTAPLPGITPDMPMLMFSDSVHRFFIREERGGLLIGGADPEPLPADRLVDADAPPPVGALPHDHAHRMRTYLRTVETIAPSLARAEIRHSDAGLPVYTADRRFIADSVPGHPGLYLLGACNEAGITHGPGLGRHLAQLIVEGRTDHDRARYAFDRF
ncbi:MAG: FAD-dependent oxidoreductase [Candidatus Latescibacteria bacterium]|nr:FAD-dependent oxidoreductase [Candidatus Latescibacterota bacterium]